MHLQMHYDDRAFVGLMRQERRWMPRRFLAACYLAMSEVLTRALPLTPFRTGRLRRSAYVTRGNPIRAGFATPYAPLIHATRGQWWQRAFSANQVFLLQRIDHHFRSLPFDASVGKVRGWHRVSRPRQAARTRKNFRKPVSPTRISSAQARRARVEQRRFDRAEVRNRAVRARRL